MKTLLLILLTLNISTFTYAGNGKYIVHSILLDKSGMLTEIGIKYYQPIQMESLPNQYMLSGKEMLGRGIKDLKVVEKTAEYNVFEFKITLDEYDHVFGKEELSYTTAQPLAWPYTEIDESNTFVPILISKNWVIGFSLGDIAKDPFVKKWFNE